MMKPSATYQWLLQICCDSLDFFENLYLNILEASNPADSKCKKFAILMYQMKTYSCGSWLNLQGTNIQQQNYTQRCLEIVFTVETCSRWINTCKSNENGEFNSIKRMQQCAICSKWCETWYVKCKKKWHPCTILLVLWSWFSKHNTKKYGGAYLH